MQAELVRICREDIYPPIIPLIDCQALTAEGVSSLSKLKVKKDLIEHAKANFIFGSAGKTRSDTRRLSDWLDENRPLTYENIPFTGVSESDFDDGLLWRFANAFEGESLGGSLYQTAEFLKKIYF